MTIRPTIFPDWVFAGCSSLDWSVGEDGVLLRAENCEEEGIDAQSLMTCAQVHGHETVVVDRDVLRSRAMGEVFYADSMITNEIGVTLGIRTADCVPVLLCDVEKRCVAAVHSGWRGTAERIVENVIQKMSDIVGSEAENIVAAIGPHIRSEHYVVNQDVVEAIGEEFSRVSDDGNLHMDLTGAVMAQLKGCGVRCVEDCGIDTYASDVWPSYRETKTKERMLSYIAIK